MKYSKDSKYLFSEGPIVLSCLLILGLSIIGNKGNTIVSVVVLTCSLLFINTPEYLLPSIFVSSLLGDYFVFIKGIGVSRLLTVIYILFTAIQVLKKHVCFPKKTVLLLFAGSLFVVFSSLFSITGNLTPAITMILSFLMVFFMSASKLTNKDSFWNNFFYSNAVFSLYVLFCVLTKTNMTYTLGRLTFIGTNINQTAICIAGLACFWAFCFLTNRKKLISFLLFFGMLIVLYSTGSRTSMIALILTIGLMILNSMKDRRSRVYVVIFTFLAIGAYYIIINSDGQFSSVLNGRYSIESIISSGGTGRTILWQATIEYIILKRPIWGIGFGGENTQIALMGYVDRSWGVHNMYLSVIAQTGTVGAVFFFSYLIRVLKKGIHFAKYEELIRYSLYALVSFMIIGIGEEIFSERFFWFVIGLILLGINNMDTPMLHDEIMEMASEK